MSLNEDPNESPFETDGEFFGEMSGAADAIIERYKAATATRERRRNLCALAAPMIAAELQGSRGLSFDPEKIAKAAQKQLASIEELLADAEQLGVDLPTSAMLRTRSLRVPPRPPRPSREELTTLQMIDYLRRESGDVVALLNRDGNSHRITCDGRWTGYMQRAFAGTDLAAAVREAYQARCDFDRVDLAQCRNEQPGTKPNEVSEEADALLDASRGADGLYT